MPLYLTHASRTLLRMRTACAWPADTLKPRANPLLIAMQPRRVASPAALTRAKPCAQPIACASGWFQLESHATHASRPSGSEKRLRTRCDTPRDLIPHALPHTDVSDLHFQQVLSTNTGNLPYLQQQTSQEKKDHDTSNSEAGGELNASSIAFVGAGPLGPAHVGGAPQLPVVQYGCITGTPDLSLVQYGRMRAVRGPPA